MRNVKRELVSIRWGSKHVQVGDKGTFFGGLPGEPVRQATGIVVRIVLLRDFAAMGVLQSDGQIAILKH